MSDKRGENKLFLGGLSTHTGKESLMTYFGDFGEVVDAVVIMDGEGKSRGFGFITFSDRDSYDKCLETNHEIDGKTVEVKPAVPKGESRSSGNDSAPRTSTRVKKLFLGGLSLDTTEENIREALLPLFPNDTSLTITIMTDKDTNKPRGFAFATAEPPPDRSDDCIYDSVDEITHKKFIKILDRSVEVKGAVPKDEISRRGGGGGSGGGSRGQQRPSTDYGSGGYNRYDDAYTSYQRASYEAMRDYYSRSSREYGMAGYPAMSMPGGYERTAGASSYYPDSSSSAAASAYPAYWMGGAGGYQQTGYQQAGSNYGPTRGYSDGAGDRRDRSSSSQSYHPYSRR